MKKKFIASLLLAILTFITGYAAATDKDDAQQLKEAYSLQKHSEGGWFAELYTSPFKQNDRATAGSIYFLAFRCLVWVSHLKPAQKSYRIISMRL